MTEKSETTAAWVVSKKTEVDTSAEDIQGVYPDEALAHENCPPDCVVWEVAVTTMIADAA